MRPWSRRYDAIWVDDVLWHLHPMQAFIDEVRRRLTPGGVIVASVVNGAHHANKLPGDPEPIALEMECGGGGIMVEASRPQEPPNSVTESVRTVLTIPPAAGVTLSFASLVM